MFNSLTRVGNTLFSPGEVRLCVQGPNHSYHLLLRDGTRLEISAHAAESILELAQSSEIVEKARAIVEAVNGSGISYGSGTGRK